jgi:basic membrane protein A
MRLRLLVALGTAAALVLSACGADDSASGTPGAEESGVAQTSVPATSGAASDVKVGLAYDIGGRGDKSYNDAAALGLDTAAAEFGVEVKELEAGTADTDAQREERLRLLADGGYDPIIAVGFAYATSLQAVAADYPDVHFAIVDDSSFEAPNVANLRFAESQSSFLAGVIAAQASKAGRLGFIGGVNIPGIQTFFNGFKAGAQAVNADIVVDEKYLTEPPDFSGFNDPAKAKTVAQGLLDGGADVIYTAAGGSGSGSFEAVAASDGAWAIGVDSDQFQSADPAVRDIILTSALKRVDTAVFDVIKAAVEGAPLSGLRTFDVTNDGVGFSDSNPALAPYIDVANEYVAKLKDGTVTAPAPA